MCAVTNNNTADVLMATIAKTATTVAYTATKASHRVGWRRDKEGKDVIARDSVVEGAAVHKNNGAVALRHMPGNGNAMESFNVEL